MWIDINFLIDVAHKVEGPLHRDYLELCSLQASSKPSERFIGSAITRTNKLLLDALQRTKIEVFFADDLQHVLPEDGLLISSLPEIDNFACSIPFFSTAIAQRKKGQIDSCVINFPALNETYYAIRGKGAWIRDSRRTERLRPSTKIVNSALIIADYINQSSLQDIPHISRKQLRITGSAAYAGSAVARGRAGYCYLYAPDAVIAQSLELLIQEAGGKSHYKIFTDEKNDEHKVFIGSNVKEVPRILK